MPVNHSISRKSRRFQGSLLFVIASKSWEEHGILSVSPHLSPIPRSRTPAFDKAYTSGHVSLLVTGLL